MDGWINGWIDVTYLTKAANSINVAKTYKKFNSSTISKKLKRVRPRMPIDGWIHRWMDG